MNKIMFLKALNDVRDLWMILWLPPWESLKNGGKEAGMEFFSLSK